MRRMEWGVGVMVVGTWVDDAGSQVANHGTKVILWNCLTHRRSSCPLNVRYIIVKGYIGVFDLLCMHFKVMLCVKVNVFIE